MKKGLIIISIFLSFTLSTIAQNADSTEVKLEKLRKESGVDPTRVSTRFVLGQELQKPSGSGYSYNSSMKLNVGVGAWAFSLKTRIRSTYTPGEPTGKFVNGIDDFTFALGNTVYYKGRNAINVGMDLTLPFGSPAFSGQALLATPNFTYAYTFSPKLIFAINPQYTFSVVKSDLVPQVSIITVRPFIANFLPSGTFIVIEPRLLYDLKAKQFNMIFSPIFGKSLGKGWNIVGIAELPLTNDKFNTDGGIYKFGVQKNF